MDKQVNDAETDSKYPQQEAKNECIQICPCELATLIPKYADLKSEIIALIPATKYERTYNKAKRFHKSFAMPKYKTPSDGVIKNKLFDIEESWEKDERITVNETFVLFLVVDYNIIQFALKKCIEQRLVQIFHLRKKLFIVINKYGSPHFGNHNELYLPVNDQITTMGPLLVTSSLKVSQIIASQTKEGMTLTIIPQSNYWKAFDATKLPTIDPYKQFWLIDFEYLPIIKIKTSEANCKESLSTCKI